MTTYGSLSTYQTIWKLFLSCSFIFPLKNPVEGTFLICPYLISYEVETTVLPKHHSILLYISLFCFATPLYRSQVLKFPFFSFSVPILVDGHLPKRRKKEGQKIISFTIRIAFFLPEINWTK